MKGSPFQRNFGISPVKKDKRTGIMPEVKSKEVKSNMPEVTSKEVKSNMPTYTGETDPKTTKTTKTTKDSSKKAQPAKGKHSYTKTKTETKTSTKSSKPSTKKSWQQTVNEKRKAGIGYETTIKRGKDGKVTSSGITFSDGTYLAD